jgi:hypothetical protein
MGAACRGPVIGILAIVAAFGMVAAVIVGLV